MQLSLYNRVSPWLAFSLRCVQCKTPTKNYNNTTKNVMALEMLPSAPFRQTVRAAAAERRRNRPSSGAT